MIRCAFILVLLALGQISYAQKSPTIVVSQVYYRFAITMPNGWENDEKSAKEMRLVAAMHPDTSKWTKAPIVMYANVTFKTDSNQTLEDITKVDILNFKKDSKGVVARESHRVKTYPQGIEAAVYVFENDELNNYESVAYIVHKHHVVMLVVGSRDKSRYEASLPQFEQLVQSYYDMYSGFTNQ